MAEAKSVLVSHLLDAAWRNQIEQTIPPETHPDLVKTFKRFFYAGARAVLHDLVYSDALEDGDEPTPGDLQKVEAILHEIKAFFDEVVAGRQ